MTANLPTEFDLSEVRSGIRVFVRLFGLESDPIHAKYAAGEFDAYDALDAARNMLRDTSRFVGKRKHVGKSFDFVDDVKQDMSELLLVGQDTVTTAVKRKRHLPLYHLVVSPVLEVFRKYDHATAIEIVDEVIDHICDTAFVDSDYGSYDDALVAQAQARTIIREREEQNKLEAVIRRKKSRREAKLLEAEVQETMVD